MLLGLLQGHRHEVQYSLMAVSNRSVRSGCGVVVDRPPSSLAAWSRHEMGRSTSAEASTLMVMGVRNNWTKHKHEQDACSCLLCWEYLSCLGPGLIGLARHYSHKIKINKAIYHQNNNIFNKNKHEANFCYQHLTHFIICIWRCQCCSPSRLPRVYVLSPRQL